MSENKKATDTGEPTAFRLLRSRKLRLMAISSEKGHTDLSMTLNEAVQEYIQAYERNRAA